MRAQPVFLQPAMNRSSLVKGAIAIQCLLGVGYLGVGTISLLPSPPVTNEWEAFASAAWPRTSLTVVFGLIAIGLLALGGTYGLWRGRLWGWWVSLFVDLVWAYQTISFKDFRYLDAGQITFGALLVTIPVGLLLLPDVRKSYWRS